MKKILLSAVFALAAISANAQLADGSTAPDFTETDIYGTEHSLYADYLDQGKPVLLNISATWCGPCWNYHNSHHLSDFYYAYGPDGSDEAMVLYVEGDETNTNTESLYGTGPNTQGNWVEGTPYTFIESGAIANAYQITYFPTIYRICDDGITTELNQLTAAGLRDSFSNGCNTLAGVADHVRLVTEDVIYTCGEQISFNASMRNYGNNNVTSAVVTLKENGTVVATENFSGDVAQFSNGSISFTDIDIDVTADYTLSIESVNGNDVFNEDFAVSDIEVIIAEEVEHVDLTVKVYTDNYPAENSWNIKDSSGAIIASGGPYQGAGGSASGGPDALSVITSTIQVEPSECYSIELMDTYGDGWGYTNADHHPGVEVLENGIQLVFVSAKVPFSDDEPLVRNAAFSTASALDNETFESSTFAMYPNPSTGIINISTTEAVNVEVVDITGKTVHQANALESNASLDLSALPKGVYLVKVKGEKTNVTEKLILK